MKKVWLGLLLVVLSLVPMTSAHGEGKLKVVATTSIIADVARNVGGDLVEVTSIVPFDTDVHAFQLSPQDVRLAEEADILLVNGMGLESFLGSLVENVGTPSYPVSSGLAVLAFGGHDHDDEHSEGMGGHSDSMGGHSDSMGGHGGMMAMGAMTGGYATLTNTTDQDIVVMMVAGNSFGVGEMHETTVTDGIARMMHLEDGLLIPANSSVELRPGGLHMMFLDVRESITMDSLFSFNVVLADGRTVPVEAAVSMTPVTGNRFEGEGLVITDLWVRPVEVAKMDEDHHHEGDHDHDHMGEMEATAKGHMHEGGTYLGYYLVDVMCDDAHDHEGEEGEHSEEGEHAHGACDPHVWTDPTNVIVWAENIAEIFAMADPEHAGIYRANAEAYSAELRALNDELKALFAGIPAENRVIVTNHEFLAYFAVHYGFEVVGTVIGGGTTLAEPSPQDIAALVEVIRGEGVRAIFAEASNTSRLSEAIAAEVGGAVQIVTLYSDSLSNDEVANTYIKYMRANAQLIADALSQ